jgi:hypothetical protein
VANPKFGLVGANVTLFGTNLNVGTIAVKFNDVPATIALAQSNDSQSVTSVPQVAPGDVKITITTSGGSATSQDTFKVLQPQPPAFLPDPNSQFNPKSGTAGTTVTLFGSNVNVEPVTVKFGNVQAQVGSKTVAQIVTTVPAMPTGPVNITVQTGGGPSPPTTNQFTVT